MKRLVAATAMVVLAATGCGGGSSKPAADKVATSPSASATSDTTLPSSTPSIGGLGNLQGDCLKAAEEFSKSAQAFSPTNPNADLSVTFNRLAGELKALKDAVSNQSVKDALDTLASAYSGLGDKLQGTHYVPGSGSPPPAAYLAAIRSFADPKFAAASKVLSSYFGEGCKK